MIKNYKTIKRLLLGSPKRLFLASLFAGMLTANAQQTIRLLLLEPAEALGQLRHRLIRLMLRQT